MILCLPQARFNSVFYPFSCKLVRLISNRHTFPCIRIIHIFSCNCSWESFESNYDICRSGLLWLTLSIAKGSQIYKIGSCCLKIVNKMKMGIFAFRFGRRKSWLVPAQLCIGSFIITIKKTKKHHYYSFQSLMIEIHKTFKCKLVK